MSGTIVSKSSQLYSESYIQNLLKSSSLWIDFSDTSKYTLTGTGNTLLASVTDKSNNGRTITITGSVGFDEAHKSMFNLAASTTNYLTANVGPISVRKHETVFLAVSSSTNENNNNYFLYGGTNANQRQFRGGSVMLYGNVTGLLSLPNSKVMILTVVADSTIIKQYYNGKLDSTGAGNVSLTTPSTYFGGNGTTNFRGNYFEILIFDQAISDDHRTLIEYYLAQKWSITSSTITSPTNISGCTLWLDGNDTNTITYSSGSNISQWADKSGNNYHAIQNTAARQPTYDPNVRGVNFVASTIQFMTTSSPFVNTNDECIYVVYKTSGIGANCTLIGTNDSGSGRQIRTYAGRLSVYNGGTQVMNGSKVMTSTELHVVEFINVTGRCLLNSDRSVDGNTTRTTFASGNWTDIIGGTRSSITNLYDGIIYEVVKFNRALTGSERQNILNYLYIKWNISVNPSLMNSLYLARKPFPRTISASDIYGCQLWLDAADPGTLTLTGSNVTTWADKSGFGRNATGNGNTTLTTIGNNTAITLDGTTTTFSGSTPNTTNSYTVFAVMTLDLGTINRRLVAFGTTSTEYAIGVTTAGDSRPGIQAYRSTDTTSRISTTGFDYDTPIIACTVIYRDSVYIYTNGVRTHISENVFTGTFNYTAYCISRSAASTAVSPNSVWKGKLGEILIFNRPFFNAERQQMEGYLAQKWGITKSYFPSTHLFKSELALSTPFDPRKIGCVMWLDAADSSTFTYPNGSFQWNDKGSNYNFTTGAGLVTPRVDSIPYKNMGCVNFVYYDNQLVSTVNNRLTANVNRSMFMVCNLFGADSIITMGTGNFATASPATAFGMGMDMSPGGWLIYTPYIYTANDNVQSAALTGTHFMYSYYQNTAPITIGGGYNFTGYTTKTVTSLNTTARPWYLGRRPDGAGSLNGGICELIVFDSVLNNADRQKVEGYLAWKWGIQGYLPATHAYKKYPP